MNYLQLPAWVRFRREASNIVTIVNLKTDHIFVSKDPFGIAIDLLSLLKEGVTTARLYEKLRTRNGATKAFVDRFCSELLRKVVGSREVSNMYTSKKDSYQQLPDLVAPLAIGLLLTYRCNSRCAHCLVGDFRYAKEVDMPLEYIKKVAQEARKYHVFKLILNGGEPMVREDFFEILEIISNEGIAIEIATNGLLLSQGNVMRMNDYNVTRYVISLEGASARTHDFIRGEGSFITTLGGLKRLSRFSKAYGVEITTTYGKHNIHEVEDIVRLSVSLGVKGLKFSRLKPWGWGRALVKYCPSFKEISHLNHMVDELQERYKGRILIEGDIPRNPEIWACNIVYCFEVQPNGCVLPCRNFEQTPTEEVILGNIDNQDIAELWGAPKARMIRQYILSLENTHATCKTCNFYRLCAYAHCLAEAFLTSPTLSEARTLRKCPLLKKVGEIHDKGGGLDN